MILPKHPMADSRGRVALHRLVASEKIGRPLEKDEVAHHLNEKKKDNRRKNISVKTRGKHTSDHFGGKKLVEVSCAFCGSKLVREQRQMKGKLVFCSRAHSSAYYVPKRKPKAIQHGTVGGYRRKCRCGACRAAQAAAVKTYRNRL